MAQRSDRARVLRSARREEQSPLPLATVQPADEVIATTHTVQRDASASDGTDLTLHIITLAGRRYTFRCNRTDTVAAVKRHLEKSGCYQHLIGHPRLVFRNQSCAVNAQLGSIVGAVDEASLQVSGALSRNDLY
jgi:hypothetical protein